MTIGEIITKYCREHGISYQLFASRCNVSKAYISMLVNGKNPKTGKPLRPTIETYQSLAKGMDMTLDQLFNIMDDAPVRLNFDTSKIAPKVSKEQYHSRITDGLITEAMDEDPIWQRREALRRDPKRKVLFDLAENGTDRDIDAAVKLLDALRATNPDFYDGDDPA